MPQLGESIAEATIVSLLVQPGGTVKSDQDVLEVETNKATMNVTSPASGTIAEYTVVLNESYPVGAVLGYLELTAEEAEKRGLTDDPAGSEKSPAGPAGEQASTAEKEAEHRRRNEAGTRVQPTVRGLPVPAQVAGASYMSPRMKARMQELGLHAADMSGIAGSGSGGRVTIDDFEKFLKSIEQKKQSNASSMRVAVADAMRRSWSRPLATVGLPVKLDAVLEHRNTCDPKPGPALYALRALAVALAENSAPAGRLIGNKIVHPSAIDVGFAVEAEDGVLVPVIRDADTKSLRSMTQRYAELVQLARQRKLPPDATGGSIATVTNFGTFGLTWATPIPLPEQTLVLGMGAGRKVPEWNEERETFLPVTEALLTLSFDHRVLDGGAAGRLLLRITELMSQPAQL